MSSNSEEKKRLSEAQSTGQKYSALDAELAASKRIEHALRHLSAVVEFSDDAIISKSLEGIITSWNRSAERMFGYTEQEAIGQPITMLIPDDHHDEEPDILRRIRAGDRIDHYETVRKRKDGTLINISLTVSPIKDGHGRIVGASKIVRDVSEKVRTNAILAESLKREQAAARAKDNFLAMLSHELRAPLTPVLLIASDAAQNPKIPAAIREQFDTIRKNIQLEARLIDDLLDLNRIQHGKLLLEEQVVDLNDLIRSSVQIVQGEIDNKRIQLKLDLAPRELPAEVDAVRMQQVFWNILSNAVKFTPEGGAISIESRLSDNLVQVKIADTGIGMSPEELKSIFNTFAQGDHANESPRYGGLGLGLAITRMLVVAHAGRVEAASNGRNTGSVFTVQIPAASVPAKKLRPSPEDADSSASSPEPTAVRGRILLVEDHGPTRTALATLLGHRGYHVMKAASVTEARSLAQTEQIDFVISDIGLPDGNGHGLMAELRHGRGLKGIALTGYGSEEDVQRANAAGFVTHLTKPVNIQSLEKALAILINRTENP